MATSKEKNIVERLATAGEDAINRLGSAPGADKVLKAVGSMRDRVDDLSKRVRGLEALEKRVAALERRVNKLEGKGKPGGKGGARKTAASAKRSSGKTESSGATG
jgi:hypothetical protein